MELILASQSPRRRRILSGLGVSFRVEPPQVDEVVLVGDLRGSVLHNARIKAAWCRERFPEAAVLAADTGIALDGEVIMKPRDRADAVRMLSRFSGRKHTVMTGMVMLAPGVGCRRSHVEVSDVRFRRLAAHDIDVYLDLVKPLDRAGAYDIDEHGELLIAGFEGSYSNIMGLPEEIVKPWCRDLGLPVGCRGAAVPC